MFSGKVSDALLSKYILNNHMLEVVLKFGGIKLTKNQYDNPVFSKMKNHELFTSLVYNCFLNLSAADSCITSSLFRTSW